MSEPKIYAALCGVMEDIGVVGKDATNSSQGFKYRSVDAVMNALNPAMIKHKVFCTPEVLEQSREERKSSRGGMLIYSICKMRYRFYTVDGSFVEAVTVGEGMDSGDKATNKAMAVAFKYACFQTFCIPTENLLDDPDAYSPKPEPSGKAENPEPNGKDEKPEEIKQLFEQLSAELFRTGYTWVSVKKKYNVDDVDKLSKLQIQDCIKKMKNLPDRQVNE